MEVAGARAHIDRYSIITVRVRVQKEIGAPAKIGPRNQDDIKRVRPTYVLLLRCHHSPNQPWSIDFSSLLVFAGVPFWMRGAVGRSVCFLHP